MATKDQDQTKNAPKTDQNGAQAAQSGSQGGNEVSGVQSLVEAAISIEDGAKEFVEKEILKIDATANHALAAHARLWEKIEQIYASAEGTIKNDLAIVLADAKKLMGL